MFSSSLFITYKVKTHLHSLPYKFQVSYFNQILPTLIWLTNALQENCGVFSNSLWAQ